MGLRNISNKSMTYRRPRVRFPLAAHQDLGQRRSLPHGSLASSVSEIRNRVLASPARTRQRQDHPVLSIRLP